MPLFVLLLFLSADIGCGVDSGAVFPDLEMQVVSAGIAGVADPRYCLACTDSLAYPDREGALLAVGVEGLKAVAVAYHYIVSPAGMVCGSGDGAGGRRYDYLAPC